MGALEWLHSGKGNVERQLLMLPACSVASTAFPFEALREGDVGALK